MKINDRFSYLRVHHSTRSVTQLSHSFHGFHMTNYVNNYVIPFSVQQMSNRISGILYPYLLIFYKAVLLSSFSSRFFDHGRRSPWCGLVRFTYSAGFGKACFSVFFHKSALSSHIPGQTAAWCPPAWHTPRCSAASRSSYLPVPSQRSAGKTAA